MFEIERKFLVNRPLVDILKIYKPFSFEMIEQVYLPNTGKWAIRARSIAINGVDATKRWILTMKRRKTALTAVELEEQIFPHMYEAMKANCNHSPIIKKRWTCYIPNGDSQVEFVIDEFLNPELDNLVMAEVELKSEDQEFPRPDWLGEEVTGVKGYSNAAMAKRLTFEERLTDDETPRMP